MFKTPRRVFIILILLALLLIAIDLPENYHLKFRVGPVSVDRIVNPLSIHFSLFGMAVNKDFKTQLGLDLSGGANVTLEANMKDIKPADRTSALDSAKQVIERRVNLFGVSEPIVQSAQNKDSYRILVELPGVTDVNRAIALIGQTAQLEFREFTNYQESSTSAFLIPTLDNTKSTGLTGKDLTRALMDFSSQTGEPEVSLEFNSAGGAKFDAITKRLIGKPLAIFLDDFPVTWPRVNTEISDGKAVITGSFTQDAAKTLALQLNAGALPVPVTVVEKQTVGATLGQESVIQSIRAGGIGLLIVAAFMIAKYEWLGLFADMALILYGLLNFAIYRWIPITLTLPGVAGFLLSIGMAVDSNILIFERFKEEKRLGKPWRVALELGFGRAWDSIRDANITTMITCAVLFNPGNWQFLPSSGMVRGFAVTLFIGVVTSLFTGIIVTRTFLRVLYKEKDKKKSEDA
ncbi:MAG TPA: protein translocase subunit SecD [Patescibacteria group bacterium]|nr:protein translocase subunit SecD [Patescibacteria group bacterium]